MGIVWNTNDTFNLKMQLKKGFFFAGSFFVVVIIKSKLAKKHVTAVLQRNMMESPFVAMKDARIMQRLENTVNYIYVIYIATKK